MLKKILVTLLIVPVIAAAIYGYFHFKQIKTPLSSVIQAIPSNVAAILKCNNPKASLKNFSTSNPVWNNLLTNNLFGEIHKDMRFIDGLFQPGSESLKALEDKPLFITIHPDAENQFGLLYFFNLPNTVSKKQVNDFILNSAPKGTTATSRVYDGVLLNELTFADNTTLYYFFTKGIFGCTFSRFLMEDAIMQLNSGIAISADPSFDKVWNAAGKKVEATLFVNYAYSAQVLQNILQKNASAFTNSLSAFANWTAMDVKVKADAYQLTGFTFSKDSSNNYLNIFNGQEPVECGISSAIPASTAYLQCFCLSDVNSYFKHYDSYLNSNKENYSRSEKLSAANKLYGVQAQNFFKQCMGSTFGYVITEAEQLDYAENCYAYISTNKQNELNQTINDFKQKVNAKAGSSDTLNESYRGYTLQKINFPNLIPLVFGEEFEKVKEGHFVQLKNALLFANSGKALKYWINQVIADKTLQNDKNYKELAENLASKSTLFIYSAPARSTNLYLANLKPDFMNWDDAKAKILKNFHALAFQLNAAPNLFYSNAYLHYKDCYSKIDNAVLELETDTIIVAPPTFLKTPADSSIKIFVQDAANKIYLFENNGKLIWKRALSETIKSRVTAVHAAHSKELALLFSTASRIYLLNDEGENEGKYPVQLPYTATNGVAAVDYDNSGEYRFLIATETNRIYNFSFKGDRVNGWEANPLTDPVRAEISNFRAKGLDYLVVVDTKGTVQLLDRKGKSVSKFKSKYKNLLANKFVLDVQSTLNMTSIVACDSSGLATRLYFSGKMEKVQAAKPSGKIAFYFHPKSAQYYFSSNGKATIYDSNAKLVAEYKLANKSNESTLFLAKSNGEVLVASNVFGKGISLLHSSKPEQIEQIETESSSAITAVRFFGDQTWCIAFASGNKVKVYPVY